MSKNEDKIVQFPGTKEERQKIRKKLTDPRLIWIGRFRWLSGWLLCVTVLFFCSTNYQIFLPDNFRRMLGYVDVGARAKTEDLTVINYLSGSADTALPFGSSLAVNAHDRLYVAKPGGYLQLNMQVPYADAVLEAGRSHLLCYDRGGTGVTVANALSPTYQISLSSPILSASIGDSGIACVVTDETGYKSAVTVLNLKGEMLHKWQSSQYYIMSAAVSPDGQRLAVNCFQQDGVTLVSKIITFRIGEKEIESETSLDGQMGLDVKFLSNDEIGVLCDGAAFVFSPKGEKKASLSYAPSELLSYDLAAGSFAVAVKSYQKSTRAEVRLLYPIEDGAKPVPVKQELQSISCRDGRLAVLTTAGLDLYDKEGNILYQQPDETGARRAMLRPDGSVFLLGSKSAKIITPTYHQEDNDASQLY